MTSSGARLSPLRPCQCTSTASTTNNHYSTTRPCASRQPPPGGRAAAGAGHITNPQPSTND